ncbi:hypothetical protein Hthe01_14370 [Hydrogenophilus thermoluteolus]|uniref:porin n=1 Tax=Hydrogenophilus thermoluteolus TaxID=297 RepID=UPI0024A459C4|nr:porin [Hydrogenophilus thermoluteolus]GLW61088.1 hypothetical protein Hthe01_14370 [Hydrogenophilus thermoluteolus]
MQKKLIALAVAGLVAAPAMAQSNVTIYGVADAYFGFGSDDNDDISAINSGGLAGSRIGFKGSEDLGNGLKAVFTLEQGYAIDTGKASPSVGDSVFSRQAWVGLQGSFGTVSLGRQYAPGYFVADYDALLSSSAISPQSTLSVLNGMTITPNSPARWDNSVKYTGSFDAVNVQAIYSMGTTEVAPSGVSDDDKYGLSAAYANGPVNVGVIYHNVGGTGTNPDQKEWLIGAGYDFGAAKVVGSYQKVSDSGNVRDLDAKLWNLGVIVPMGGGNIHVAYAQSDVDFPNMGENWEPSSYTLAYTYPFSKRTTAYAGYQKLDYDTDTKDDKDLFVVGVNHKF